MRKFSTIITRGMLFLILIGTSIATLHFNVRAQESKLQEPESIGILYWRDPSNNALVPLDRENTATKASGLFVVKAKLRIKGATAKLRLKPDPTPEFIVQLANGVDPNKIKLYLLKVEGDARTTVVATVTAFGGKAELQTLSVDVKKYGQNSYKLTPAQPLAQGEYAFNAVDSPDAFCFRIEVPKIP